MRHSTRFATLLMQAPPDYLSGSQCGPLNRSTNGVAAIAHDRQAEVVRPRRDPAGVAHIAAKRYWADAYHDAADISALALKHPINKLFDLPTHARTNVDAFSSNGYPHGYLSIGWRCSLLEEQAKRDASSAA